MGVSGSGKTTLGEALSAETKLPFYDGDDYHPIENIKKMSAGVPLDDSDRSGWLKRLNALAREHQGAGAVIACSAPKESYRKILQTGLNNVVWIYLEGSYAGILERLANRTGHYMPSSLLKSQFQALEPPPYALKISEDTGIEQALLKIREAMGKAAG